MDLFSFWYSQYLHLEQTNKNIRIWKFKSSRKGYLVRFCESQESSPASFFSTLDLPIHTLIKWSTLSSSLCLVYKDIKNTQRSRPSVKSCMNIFSIKARSTFKKYLRLVLLLSFRLNKVIGKILIYFGVRACYLLDHCKL